MNIFAPIQRVLILVLTSIIYLSACTGSDESYDAANIADLSNTFPVITTDTTDPSAPGNLKTSAGSPTSSFVQLVWDASIDNVAVSGYRLMRGNTLISTTTSTTYIDTAVSPGVSYQYAVIAFDAANNTASSHTLTVSTPDTPATTDTTNPSAPANLRTASGSPTSSSIQLLWNTSTDNVAVSGYRVMRGNTLVTTTTSTTYTDTAVSPEVSYQYTVIAFDAANNTASSNTLTVNTPAVTDTTEPSAPGNLRTASGSPTSSSVQLLWNASTDNVAVSGYRVMRGNTLITTTTSTTYTDTAVSPEVSYQYTVIAFDAANNTASSNTLAVSTPGNTTGVATLNWTPPTENTDESLLTDLMRYKIYYGLSPSSLTSSISVNNVGLTSYVIENLNTNTTYYFSITSFNSSGVESDLSNIVSKTTT